VPLFFSFKGAVVSSKNVLVDKIEQLSEPVLREQGAELVDLQFVHEHGQWVLRYFVDKVNGVTLDDCAVISEHLSRVLDATDVIQQHYALEVSSPGINRPLKKEADFQRFVGERVDITLYAPINGRRHFKGNIEGVECGSVVVKDHEMKTYPLPLADIAKAKLDPEITF
jgi:ribosome maturation factor RimP